MKQLKVKRYHSHKDFKYGTWSHEHHSDGGMVTYGILKKTGNKARYLEIYPC